ncbi:17 kDa surface antigen [Methylotenera versatilis 301]|uniref:17 kDa surface antigen n=2 Tax=Methylotenera TaxID=359407 RepID=D7DM72_METV0|nr:17 kDa surface antigen [Methylotenera versatilis 301]
MKKQSLIILAIFATNVISTAVAGQDAGDHYYDQAKVLSVTPQFERINTPTQQCHTEYARETYSNGDRSVGGSIIGGVAGALLGSTIGRGNGRVAAAAVGAGVGAIAGDRIDNQNNNTQTTERPVDRCTLVDNWQTVSRGYLVNYSYNGRSFSTTTYERPRDTIRISVAVAPVNSEASYNQTYDERGYESNGAPIGHQPPPHP